MIDNYPPGAANDPRAPYNEKEPTHVECDECGGTGLNGHECGEDVCFCKNPEDNIECAACEGEGVFELEDDESDGKDWDAIAKEDRLNEDF